MTDESQIVELDIRRKGQELAVAWRKGKASYVLESLATEDPLRAALIATLVHEALARWDPYDAKWPNGFRRALLLRSQGAVSDEEISELEREYSRVFGASPPRPTVDSAASRSELRSLKLFHVSRIREALDTGRPIARERAPSAPMFLRPQPARR